jgi:GNAT superfamily N-acetyltransferase
LLVLVFSVGAWRDRTVVRAWWQRRRSSRLIARVRPEDHGLVPTEELDPRCGWAPEAPELTARRRRVADAAWDGDWQTPASYVAEAGQDWDERWSRLQLLQHLADQDDTWLEKWRTERPTDGDAATLYASLLVHRAWQRRGSGYANEISDQAKAEFKALLPAGMEAARAAAALAPHDPGPWVVMVTAARGLNYKNEQFQPLWQGLHARAPYHYDGHWQALQYWCAKWHGSNRLMMQFAEAAAVASPPGSPLAGMYLHALNELRKRKAALPAGREAGDRLEAVHRALATVPADNDHLPPLRHMLAHQLVTVGRYRAALEQFRLIGRWCGAFPWTEQADALTAFDDARRLAAARASRASRAE